MQSLERLFVSAVVLVLPAVVVTQVAVALLCAATGHRGQSSAVSVLLFTLLAMAGQVWCCRVVRNREHAGRQLALVATLLGAVAWVGVAVVTDHSIAGLFRPPVVLSAVVILAVSLGIASAWPWLAEKLPRELDNAFSSRRSLAIAWAVFALVAVANVARLCVFMADASQTWASAFPPLEIRHQCLPAYVRAAELSRQGVTDLWDVAHYPNAQEQPRLPESNVEQLAPHLGDPFLYPPTFLLVPRAVLAVTNSYLDIRTLYFGVNLLTFLLGALALVGWIGGGAGLRAGLLLPMMGLSVATLLNFEFGQAHLLVAVLAVSGMVLFELNRPALGGLLLAAATVAKFFPGILILYLIARRQWRAAAWTLVGITVLVAATLATLGPPTFQTFIVSYLPRLASVDGVQSLEGKFLAIAHSGGVQAVPYKLEELGVPVTASARALFTWVYRALTILLVLVAARRGRERRDRAVHWLALVVLASLSGPSSPTAYLFAPALWLLTLFPPGKKCRLVWAMFMVFSFLAFQPVPPLNLGPILMVWSLAGPVVAVGLSIWIVLRRGASPESPDSWSL